MQPEWPVAFFDDDYLRIYRSQLTPERTASEVAFIAGALGVAPGAEVLDLACGLGRHAIGMAKLGCRVTGVDFNERYLAIAKDEAREAGVAVTWRARDMRALDDERAFDAAYSYFTSFGYYDDDDNERVLARIAAALRPGARFLLDMVNRDWLLTHPLQRSWQQREDGTLLMEETALDLPASRVVARQILLDPEGGPRVTKEYTLRAYTAAELAALLRRHGLRVRELWGGPEREPYGTETRRLVLLAERGA